MAIGRWATFEYEGPLAHAADGTLVAQLKSPRPGNVLAGLMGRNPRLAVGSGVLRVVASPEEAPIPGAVRRSLDAAQRRSLEWNVGATLCDLLREADVLRLSYDSNGEAALVVRRAEQPWLGLGGWDVIAQFRESAGILEFRRGGSAEENLHAIIIRELDEKTIHVGESVEIGPARIWWLQHAGSNPLQPQDAFACARLGAGLDEGLIASAAREFLSVRQEFQRA